MNPLVRALEIAAAALDRAGRRWALVGGFAVSAMATASRMPAVVLVMPTQVAPDAPIRRRAPSSDAPSAWVS